MNPTLEILTLERERLELRYAAQRSLLDSIIAKLQTYDKAPLAPAVPEVNAVNAVTAVPVVQAAPKAVGSPSHRRSPAGSKSILIRRAILDRSGPVTAAEITEATGLPKPTVSGFMSACVERGELDRAGTRNDRQLYKPTEKFQRPTAPTGAKAQPGANGETSALEKNWKAFRAGLSIKVPEIKLGFTEREEP